MQLVSGVHHVALGVQDLPVMQAFYRDVLGFSQLIAAFQDVEPEPMHEVARCTDLRFSGAIVNQPSGGILLEFIRMTRPAPRPLRRDFRYGDIGVGKMTIAVPDVAAFHLATRDRLNFRAAPEHGVAQAIDPEGNLLEFVAGASGGIRSVGVGVTDLNRSIAFYRDVLGLTVIEAPTANSCLLAGPAGQGALELVEAVEPRGRSMPFGACWGDFGYLQVCFTCADVATMVVRLEAAGMALLCQPKPAGPGSFAETGAFVYAGDPDGVPIEFLFLPGDPS